MGKVNPGKKTLGMMELLKNNPEKGRGIKNVAIVKQDPKDSGRLGTRKQTGNKVGDVVGRSATTGEVRTRKNTNLSRFPKPKPVIPTPVGAALALAPIAYEQTKNQEKAGSDSMGKTMVTRRKDTVRDIKGTPAETANVPKSERKSKAANEKPRAKTHHELTEEYETHKGKSKPVEHPSRGRLGAQRIKKRIDEAARRANQRSEASAKPVPRPKKKPPVPKKPVNEDKIRESLRIRKHGGKASETLGSSKLTKEQEKKFIKAQAADLNKMLKLEENLKKMKKSDNIGMKAGGRLGKTKGRSIPKKQTDGNKIVANCYKNYV
jgi:hypothetical protein